MNREDRDEGSFSLRLDSVRILSSALGCLLSSRRDAPVVSIAADESEVVFTVQAASRTAQTRCTMPAAAFEEYSVRSETVRFAVHLAFLIDCLQLFGSSDSSAVTLEYRPDCSSLNITLDAAGALACCDIPCMYQEEEDPWLQLSFRRTQELCALILRSDSFREAVGDVVELSGAVAVLVELRRIGDAGDQELWVAADGSLGRSSARMPQQSSAFISFKALAQFSQRYAVPALSLGLRGLAVGTEACVRVSQEGVLCVQHQLPLKGDAVAYLDFLMLPEEEEAA